MIRVRTLLPQRIRTILWGDRSRWGRTIRVDDPDWAEWQNTYSAFYLANQRSGLGLRVNAAGYDVASLVDFSGRTVLEVGAGDLRHDIHWNGVPGRYIVVDVNEAMIARASESLERVGVGHELHNLRPGDPLPVPDNSIDIVLSFYSLEHIWPLGRYLGELKRVLRTDGLIAGAVPTEGGLAWGAGRALTSRRWLRKHTTIDPDKLICWEHPNFSDDVVDELDRVFKRVHLSYWPFRRFSHLQEVYWGFRPVGRPQNGRPRPLTRAGQVRGECQESTNSEGLVGLSHGLFGSWCCSARLPCRRADHSVKTSAAPAIAEYNDRGDRATQLSGSA